MFKVILICAVLCYINNCYGDTSMGKCTEIEPVADFDIKNFLGRWYVIQKTSTSTPCITYSVDVDEEKAGQFKITEFVQHSTLWSSGLHHQHTLTVGAKPTNTSGVFELDIPLSVGTTVLTVFLTDYDNYAAIFTCKKVPALPVHMWSAEIISRKPNLDMGFVDKVRTRLGSYNINPSSMTKIQQDGCPEPGTQGSVLQTASNVITNTKNYIEKVVEPLTKTPETRN